MQRTSLGPLAARVPARDAREAFSERNANIEAATSQTGQWLAYNQSDYNRCPNRSANLIETQRRRPGSLVRRWQKTGRHSNAWSL